MKTQIFGKKIIYFDSIESTNTTAKQMALQGCKEGTVVIANNQTKGRGRLGKTWISPNNTGIWMSIVARPNILPFQGQYITIIAAIAVVKALKETLNISAKIKWPNDIIILNKKVCGILTEMSCETDKINYIVIGIGINANNNIIDFPEDIKNTAISLKEIVGENIKRKELVRSILKSFEKLYLKSQSQNEKQKIINEYKNYSITLGNKVEATSNQKRISGVAIDITDQGELIIETDDGRKEKVLSGEVSVRGLNGYI